METGAQAIGPFTELVEQYGPRLWDTLSPTSRATCAGTGSS